jgi:hypothetical protein
MEGLLKMVEIIFVVEGEQAKKIAKMFNLYRKGDRIEY